MTYSLHEGDAWAYLAGLADQSVDVTICDPPYNEGTHVNAVIKQRPKQAPIGFAALADGDVERIVTECIRVTRRWVVCFCTLELLGDYRRAAQAIDEKVWVRGGVWQKPDVLPQFTGDRPGQPGEGVAIMHRLGRKRWNGGGLPAFWSFNVCHEDRCHPTQKPLPLMRRLVEQFSDPGETILDCFCGSGSTGVAAVELGRHFLGCERDPGFAAIARDRLAAAAQGCTVAQLRAGQTTLFPRGAE